MLPPTYPVSTALRQQMEITTCSSVAHIVTFFSCSFCVTTQLFIYIIFTKPKSRFHWTCDSNIHIWNLSSWNQAVLCISFTHGHPRWDSSFKHPTELLFSPLQVSIEPGLHIPPTRFPSISNGIHIHFSAGHLGVTHLMEIHVYYKRILEVYHWELIFMKWSLGQDGLSV